MLKIITTEDEEGDSKEDVEHSEKTCEYQEIQREIVTFGPYERCLL